VHGVGEFDGITEFSELTELFLGKCWLASGGPPLPPIFSFAYQGVTPPENILQPQRASREKQA
jgi:hypothetical protein